jgi:hypothetical protein
MEDITTQYQKPIYTKELHEPIKSFQTLKKWYHQPHLTLKQLSINEGIDYDKLKTWSSKYYYHTRKQAYFQNISEEIEQQTIALVTNDLEAHLQRQNTDQKIIDNDQHLTHAIQNIMVQQVDNGTIPDKQDITNYTTLKDSYHKGNKEHTITTQTIIKNIHEGIPLDKLDTSKMSPAAKRFIEQMTRIQGGNTE